jgi:RNA polymerase sigma-70 factor (ECF subfamily)
MADENDSALDKIIREENYRALYRAISLLKPTQKEVITLFYYERLSIKEIASVTDKSESVVKVTLYRAKEKLKEILTQN